MIARTTGPASHLVPTGGWAVGRSFGVCYAGVRRVVEKRGGPGRAGEDDHRLAFSQVDLVVAEQTGEEVEGRHADPQGSQGGNPGMGAGGSAESAPSTGVRGGATGSANGGAGGGREGKQREDTRFLA